MNALNMNVMAHLDADQAFTIDTFPGATSGTPFVSLHIGEGAGRITLMTSATDLEGLHALAITALDAARALEEMIASTGEVSA
ncbi:hypothetical protein ACYSUO_38695 [Streptomyces sp. UC4497]